MLTPVFLKRWRGVLAIVERVTDNRSDGSVTQGRLVRVAVDVMGADHPPSVLIAGVVTALKEHPDVTVHLLAMPDTFATFSLPKEIRERVTFVPCEQVIGMDESPLAAVRRKPNASLVVGMRLLGAGEVDAFVTPGNTGAALAAGQPLSMSAVCRPSPVPLSPSFCLTIKGVSCFWMWGLMWTVSQNISCNLP